MVSWMGGRERHGEGVIEVPAVVNYFYAILKNSSQKILDKMRFN